MGTTYFFGGYNPIPAFRPFILEVNSSSDSQYTIPTGLGVFDYSAIISDGQSFSNLTGDKTIIFPDANTNYTIEIRGIFPHFQQANNSEKSKPLDVIQYGDIVWRNWYRMFDGCTDSPNMVNVVRSSLAFKNCMSMVDCGDIDMVNVEDGTQMFQNCYVFNPTNFSPNLDVLTNGNSMFSGCYVFNPTNFSPTLDVLTDGNYMFSNCQVFNPTNFSPTLSVLTNGNQMFQNCYVFNPTNFSPTLSVLTDGRYMFYNCQVFNPTNFSPTLSVLTNGNQMFYNVTLSTTNYSQILINMESLNSNSNVPFHGGNSKYNLAGQTARTDLVSNQSWVITDGGFELSPFILEVNSGSDSQYTIPTGLGTFDYSAKVYKSSDSSQTQTFTGLTGNKTILFTDASTDYTIEIRGIFPHFYQAANSEAVKLIQLIDDGDVVFGVQQGDSFNGAINMNAGVDYNPNQDYLENGDSMYRDCDSFDPQNYAPSLNNLISASRMYDSCGSFNPPNFAPNLDNLVNGTRMHNKNTSFNPPNYSPNLSSLDGGYFMFYNCTSFDQDIIQNDPVNGTISLTTASYMFTRIKSRVIKLQAGLIASTNSSSFNCPNLEVFELIDMSISFMIDNCPLLVGSAIDDLANSVKDMTSLTSPTITMTVAQYGSTGFTPSLFTNKNWTISQV